MAQYGGLQALRRGAGQVLPLDGATREGAPWLWELLTLTKTADGKTRLPADLGITLGVGCWMVTIRCHGEGRAVTVPVESLEGLPAALERALMQPVVPWRDYESWKVPVQQSSKPKKKG